jgi:1-acyl-sn-glycerol-3-phosphate acyltransferase
MGLLGLLKKLGVGLFVACFSVAPLCAISALLALLYPLLPRAAYARAAAFLQEQFLTAFVFFFERGRGSRLSVYVSGDVDASGKVRCLGKEGGADGLRGALIVCNHVAAHGDWAPIYSLVARQGVGALGGFRCVVKDVAKWIPGFGWGMWLMNWPFLKRNWASDKRYLEDKLRAYDGAASGVPLSMLIFPEGTRWTVKKHAQAVAFAKQRGLHVPTHTMCPRYKGFQALVRGLSAGACADVVYDVTLSYTGFNMKAGRKGPGPFNVFLHDVKPGAPECAFHMHVRRLSLADVDAKDDAALKAALFDWFARKDAMMEEFLAGSKRFPGAVKLDPLPASRWLPATLFTLAQTALFVHAVRVLYTAAWLLLFHREVHASMLKMLYSFRD